MISLPISVCAQVSTMGVLCHMRKMPPVATQSPLSTPTLTIGIVHVVLLALKPSRLKTERTL